MGTDSRDPSTARRCARITAQRRYFPYVDIPAEVRELAEFPFAHCPEPPAELGFARLLDDRFVVHSTPLPTLQLVGRLRLQPDDVAEVVEEARAFLRSRGQTRAFWTISHLSTPSDLESRLLALGMRPNDEPPLEQQEVAMALTDAPTSERPRDIDAHPVESVEDAVEAVRVTTVVFGFSEEQRAAATELARSRFQHTPRLGTEPFGKTYIARLEGEVVGAARGLLAYAGINLIGGGVLEHARSRGVYRALVWARWDDACARGTPALTVQAGKMSLPILERLGFSRVGHSRVLLDRF